MGREPNKYLVGGEWITKAQAAARAGVSVKALDMAMHRYGAGPAVALRMYEEGRISRGTRGGVRHLVRGKWTTLGEEAARLGVSVNALRMWMRRNGRDGKCATLAAAVAHYEAVRDGREKTRHGGKPPRTYYVNGTRMTIAQAAERAGVSESCMRTYLCTRRCSVQSAVRFYEKRARAAAEREILRVLGY